MSKFDYKAAGVDIAAGNEVVDRIKGAIKTTHNDAVLTDIGAFGSLVDLKKLLEDYQHPVLVQSIDGVGTKTMIASLMNKFDTLGYDLLSATCNDIVVMGAKPITFLDYVATSKLDPEIVVKLVTGMVEACRACNVALVGGETAEMPDVYVESEHDMVGIITGIVEKDKVIDGRTIKPGDVVYGLPSSGLHTNGYSLARKLFFDKGFYAIDEKIPELGGRLGDVLLEPHINYNNPVHDMLDAGVDIKGMAHITGGGFLENIPRILPKTCSVKINKGSWPVLPVFQMMQKIGELADEDMYQTFNMGIGLVIIADQSEAAVMEKILEQHSAMTLYRLGEVVADSDHSVKLVG